MDKAALLDLIPLVESRSTNLRSELHGPQHWRCVAKVGIELAHATPGADPLIAFLFGLFHDCQRVNDGTDPGHGRRGAKLMRSLVENGEATIPAEILEPTLKACETHTEAGRTSDPVLGVCYDADRLNLWREGTRPLPRYLSTKAALGMIEATRRLHWEPLTWEGVLEEL